MRPDEFVDLLGRERATAILRCDDADVAARALDAAVTGGFRIVEVTLTSPGGQELVTRAEGQGQGHWLATVTLPEAGDWTWAVQMPAGLEIVQPSGPHAITVTAGPQPLDAPVLAGGMVLGFLVLLALLVVAARASDPARRAAAAPVRIARQA